MKNNDKIELNGALYDESLHPLSRGKHIVRLAQKVSLGCPVRLKEEYDTEIPDFVLTLEEAVLIIKFRTREVLKDHYNCLFMGGFETDRFLTPYAVSRFESIAKLVGRDIVKHAIDEAILEFGEQADPRHWEVFWYGTREEHEQVTEEIQREPHHQIEAEKKAEEENS